MKTVDNILIRDGVKTHLKGYFYLRDLILNFDPQTTLLNQYERIAEEKGITAKQVEKCVRDAVVKSAVPFGAGVKNYITNAYTELLIEKETNHGN